MKKRVADIVVETLIELGITECFCVVGGGAMHLNNAFEINNKMHMTFCHHEQACAFAAEGYAKYSGKIAAVSVTSGPGCVNALNGVYSAWVDSTPLFVIAGHPRTDTTTEALGLNIRCYGVQEYNIIPSVKGMTKYAKMITNADSIKYEIQKAYHIAMSGRRGPVWLSIPLDVQSAMLEEMQLENYIVEEIQTENTKVLQKILKKIKAAKSPCILTGNGIRYSASLDLFKEFLTKIRIPIVGGALLSDILPEGYPLFYGLSGNIGPRAGNFILQNADLILVLGNSLSIRQTGFNVAGFAPKASLIMVDVEKDESRKPGLRIDLPVQMDLKTFFEHIIPLIETPMAASKSWEEYCKNTFQFFMDYDDPSTSPSSRIPAKFFWKRFREKIPDNTAIALGNSNGVVGIYQYGVKRECQRVITNYNAGSMGYDLPEAIGIAVASGQQVYCITGDGSIMMNLQELETIKYNDFPIKIIVFSNDGYGAIRQTCKNFFNGVHVGCDTESGVGFPDFKVVAEAFGFQYFHCANCAELEFTLDEFIHFNGQGFLEVEQLLDDPIIPRIMSKMGKDGKFETPGFTDMFPYLSDTIFETLKYDKGDINNEL